MQEQYVWTTCQEKGSPKYSAEEAGAELRAGKAFIKKKETVPKGIIQLGRSPVFVSVGDVYEIRMFANLKLQSYT